MQVKMIMQIEETIEKYFSDHWEKIIYICIYMHIYRKLENTNFWRKYRQKLLCKTDGVVSGKIFLEGNLTVLSEIMNSHILISLS